MSLSKDISSQLSVKTCFICEFEISNKNTTTVEKEGMYFHKRCYEEQIGTANSVESSAANEATGVANESAPIYENNFELASKTNAKFIEDDICPLININKQNNKQQNTKQQNTKQQNSNVPSVDELPDLIIDSEITSESANHHLVNKKTFSLTPEVEQRKQHTKLGPEIVIKNDTKKVTFNEGMKIPAAELEYENYSEESDDSNKDTKVKQPETLKKQSGTPKKHPNVFNEVNICLECGNPIDFSKPNSFVPFDNNVANLIDYSDNMLDNFNKLGEDIAQNLPESKDYSINFYLHGSCKNNLQYKKAQHLNQSRNNKFAQSKQNEIPEDKFNEVMNIMNVQKSEEISTGLKNLTFEVKNMNNLLFQLKQKMEKCEKQQTVAENDEHNRQKLFSIGANNQNDNKKLSNFVVTNEHLRESISQLAILMLKFTEGLGNFETVLNNQEFMNARRHEILLEMFKKIETEQQNDKKRNELVVEIIQDVESTLSGKIFELAEKIGINHNTSTPKTQ